MVACFEGAVGCGGEKEVWYDVDADADARRWRGAMGGVDGVAVALGAELLDPGGLLLLLLVAALFEAPSCSGAEDCCCCC